MAVRVEWDEKKNRTNTVKHGVSFAEAAAVFRDPLSLTVPDRVVNGELRFRTVGVTGDGVLLVAHTITEVTEEDGLVRMISARHATPHERKAYEEGEF